MIRKQKEKIREKGTSFKNITLKKKTFRKSKKIWISILCVLLLLISGVFLFQKNRKNQLENNTKTVRSAQVEQRTISEDIDGSGVLSAANSVSIKMPVGIVIEKVYLESGDKVEKGDQLAKIKKSSILSALIDIESSLDTIEDKLEDDDLTDLEIEQLKLQKSELNAAKTNLTKWKENPIIKASCSGIIGEVNVSEGNETKQTTTSNTGTSSSASSNSNMAFQSSDATESITATRMIATITSTTGMITYTSNLSEASSTSQTSTLDNNQEATTQNVPENNTEDSSTKTTTEATTEAATETTTAVKEEETNSSSASSTTIPSTEKKNETFTQANNAQNNQTTQSTKNQTSAGNKSIPATSAQLSKNTASANGTVSESGTTSASNSEIYSAYEMCGFTIISLDTVKVSISVDELDILSVEKGQTATITLDALEEEEFEGTITKVASTSSSSSGNSKYAVEIELPMTENMLLGMTASATIHINQAENVPTIPMIALQEERGITFVYTESDDKGNLDGKVEVTTGLSDGSNVQIISGLTEGDTVYYTRSENSDSTKEFSFGGNRMQNGGNMPNGMPDDGQRPNRNNGQFPSGNNK